MRTVLSWPQSIWDFGEEEICCGYKTKWGSQGHRGEGKKVPALRPSWIVCLSLFHVKQKVWEDRPWECWARKELYL